MNREEIIKKVMEKAEFSKLPLKDVEFVLESLEKKNLSDEEKIKETRRILRNVYSGFGGQRILRFKDKSQEEVLKKHLSTRERLPFYREIYSRILKNYRGKKEKVSVIDLGSGANGFSYEYFEELGFNAKYIAVEAVGQLVEIMNSYFKKEKKKAEAYHLSLYEKDKVVELIKKQKSPRVIFLFKVIDSLEALKRNYTKEMLLAFKEVLNSEDVIALSFATESWFKRKKFLVERKWLIDFIRENFEFSDDFKYGGERYLVFKK